MLKKYKKLIVILGIIILPLIYSVFYLIAFWNPYGNLDKIPVALVNLDKCENNCKSTELIDKLKEKNTFDFEIVNESKAEEGLVNKDYYAIIKIPQNFTSSFEENNHSTEIIYNPNKKTNYLASQIIGSAVNEIQSNLNSQTNKEITKTLTNNLKEVPEKTNVIKDGMLELKNGTDKLNNGSNTLYNGLNALNMGYKDFSKGLTTLKNGSTKLTSNYEEFNQALNTVSNSTNDFTEKTEDLKQILDAANEIGNGISNIASNLTNYQTANNQVLSDTENTYKLIVNYVENNPDSLNDNNISAMYMIATNYLNNNTFSSLKTNLNNLITAENNLNHNYQIFNSSISNIKEINPNLTTLNQALNTLSNSSTKIKDAVKEIDNGLDKINSNSKTIENSLNEAQNGSLTLNKGLTTLDNRINTSAKQIDSENQKTSESIDKLNNLDKYAENPVKIKEKDYGNYSEYGIFFAPYFMSLSLWVGGVLIMMGLYYDPFNRFKILGRDTKNRGLRLLLYNVIAIFQAIILGFLLKICLGFTVTNNLLYYSSCILVSMTFLAIIMFLFFNFKDVGRFLALFLLIIQLTASAGTFPIETTPAFFKIINPFIPMTYSVNLFRESFVNINSSFVWSNIIILLIIFSIFTVLILITGYFKQKKAVS